MRSPWQIVMVSDVSDPIINPKAVFIFIMKQHEITKHILKLTSFDEFIFYMF